MSKLQLKLQVDSSSSRIKAEIMDVLIDKRFERVEKALATLINSMSTYNPNPALANDLVTADAELSHGLEQCELSLNMAICSY